LAILPPSVILREFTAKEQTGNEAKDLETRTVSMYIGIYKAEKQLTSAALETPDNFIGRRRGPG